MSPPNLVVDGTNRSTGDEGDAAAAAVITAFVAATHLGQIVKTRQKLHSKNSWNWVVILVSATIWQVLILNCIKIGKGNDVNQLKISLKNSWNLIMWTYFWRILPIWNHSATAPVTTGGTPVPADYYWGPVLLLLPLLLEQVFLVLPLPVESPLRTQFTKIKIQTKLLENFSRNHRRKKLV
jgi:hypothetical protein